MTNQLKKKFDFKLVIIIQFILILNWGAQLLYSDAYYVNYGLLLVVACICSYINIKNGEVFLCNSHGKYSDIVLYLFAILFSCMVFCANYKLWAYTVIPDYFGVRFKWLYKALLAVALWVGGFFAFGTILNTIVTNIKTIGWNKTEKEVDHNKVFLISFVVLVLTRWIVLYYCQYPGELSYDSYWQMKQILTNNYTNHHPFYYTMVIKFFVMLGMKLFNDINAAVATYSFFQILFTAMSFSFAVSTMAMMKVPKWIICVSMLFYILMPYHIIYAITMWKDIMFGCFVLLFITFFYRYLNRIGNSILDYVMLAISSFGVCLFRSNGRFVFVIVTIVFIVLWKKSDMKLLLLFVSAIIISFFMNYTVLAMIDVPQADTIEPLAIPTQQIARVVQEGCELDDWQKEALEAIIDIDKIQEKYQPYRVEPIKELVRQKDNQQLILDQKSKYIKLYISLGMKYPAVYLRAWIDETRGYWNAGYEYWRWYLEIWENDMGIVRTTRNASLNLVLQEYLWMFTDVQLLRVFLSIGTFVWIDLVMLMISLLKKDKFGIFVSLPILAIVVSLLIATPVFSEFRYLYSAFCALPMIIVIALRPKIKEGEGKKETLQPQL